MKPRPSRTILARIEAQEVKSGADSRRFNRLLTALTVVAIVMAFGQIIAPDGLPLISYTPPNQHECEAAHFP